ncbi:MarR family transcriptional regulator [Oscillochloris sp. ZM17-4]|uniref:MarR family winged helix-turn-helix transcriptional regulator n=1 Tax=Oscillochloris sp. ZM17-4 TaxID=2866714 RepID=UPI001C7362E4|nr:MarR family transcriptional regulator [Oscillochloris sp. ZM17-4]MBX0329349.1 MarR family transcriptional regulator [Oscillochloris sp. ZM17-4]
MPEISSSDSPQIEAYRLFLKLHRRFQELNREEFRPYDLSTPQYAILFHASEEGVPLSSICHEMLSDNSNLTRMVDRLEARGLVRRAPDSSDRRVTLVQLTPEGKALIDTLRPRHRAYVEERMSSLSPQQIAALNDAMQTLYGSLSEEA